MRSGLHVLLGLTAGATLGLGLCAAPASAAGQGIASARATSAQATSAQATSAEAGVQGTAEGRSAAAEKWSWGPTTSTDAKGWAKGEIRTTKSGLRITGNLYDAGGARTCSWLKIKWLTGQGGYRTATVKNCSRSAPRAFRVDAGHMLSSLAKVCRGTATRVTGKCSHWEGVWAQGG
ncbi:hypothetical protein [Sphaerisporangium rhizosphaerae]|uniref:Uncharacterized protein n=1 Tax=Sphaerisporangium rhizosphaerae TaxID=2269375 RepID=A0ABW2PED1_9ACTN